MSAPKRPNPHALEIVYEDLIPTLKALARELVRHYGERPDDAVSTVNADFVEAYRTHDPARGEFGPSAAYRIRGWQKTRYRNHARRRRLLHPVAPEALRTVPAARTPDRFEFGAFTAPLSHDARIVLALLYDGPEGFDAAVRADSKPGPASIRRHLIRWLAVSHGWPYLRVLTAFREIGRNL